MFPFGGIILAPLVGGYFASLICRWRLQRGLRTGYATLSISVGISVITVWLLTFGGDILKPNTSKVGFRGLLLITGVPSAILASLAAAAVIDRYNNRVVTVLREPPSPRVTETESERKSAKQAAKMLNVTF